MTQDSGNSPRYSYAGGAQPPQARGVNITAEPRAQHGVSIQNRRNISITGVIEVIGFADNYISMNTQLGVLHIIGGGLHILKLLTQSGEMTVDGRVDALEYSDADAQPGEKKRGLFSKILKG